MKSVQTTVYITEDGKEFTCEKAAMEWEDRMREVTYFVVGYHPDLTEGRISAQKRGLIQVVGFKYSEEKIARFACEKAFGGSVDFVQGVFGGNGIITNFCLGKPKKEDMTLPIVIIVQDRFAKLKMRDKEGIYFSDLQWNGITSEERKIY